MYTATLNNKRFMIWNMLRFHIELTSNNNNKSMCTFITDVNLYTPTPPFKIAFLFKTAAELSKKYHGMSMRFVSMF